VKETEFKVTIEPREKRLAIVVGWLVVSLLSMENTQTTTDREHEISEWIEKAKKAAYKKDFYNASHLLRRAIKSMKAIRGENDIQVGGLYGKLSIIQRRAGDYVAAQMSYNLALSILNDTRSGNAMGGMMEIAETSPKVKAPPKRKRGKKKRSSKSLPSLSFSEQSREERKHLLKHLNLNDVYQLPHYTMQHVADGRISYCVPIEMQDLTPRTRHAFAKMGVKPDVIRIRDLHSFYLAKPCMKPEEREKQFAWWSQRRELLYRDLLEYREMSQLKRESDQRMQKMKDEHASMAETFKVTAYGLANTNAYDNERKLARSVIPTAVNAPFRGSVVAALRCLKTPKQTPNERHRGRKPRIEAGPNSLACPACKTIWDGKDRPICRICKKKVNWQALYQSNYENERELNHFLKHKKKLRKKREKEKRKKKAARDAVLKRREDARIAKWKAQCKKKKQEKWTRISDDEEEAIEMAPKDAGASSDEEEHHGGDNVPVDFAALMESHRVAAKKKKKEDAGEDEDNIDSESSSSSDDEKEKDPSKFVETIPTGYAFPLLLSSLERDGLNPIFGGQRPTNMTSEVNLIRTIDNKTKLDVTKKGRRRHFHLAKHRALHRKKKIDQQLYMYSLTKSEKKKIPTTSTVLEADSIFATLPPPKEESWVTIQDTNKTYANDVHEMMLHKLRRDQKNSIEEAKKMNSLDIGNATDRTALSTYYLLKNAKKKDEWFAQQENLGLIGIRQELKYLQSSMVEDEEAAERTNNFTLM
jgi:hypothetical protein